MLSFASRSLDLRQFRFCRPEKGMERPQVRTAEIALRAQPPGRPRYAVTTCTATGVFALEKCNNECAGLRPSQQALGPAQGAALGCGEPLMHT